LFINRSCLRPRGDKLGDCLAKGYAETAAGLLALKRNIQPGKPRGSGLLAGRRRRTASNKQQKQTKDKTKALPVHATYPINKPAIVSNCNL